MCACVCAHFVIVNDCMYGNDEKWIPTITHILDFLNNSSFVRCLCEMHESGTVSFLTIQMITADHNNV